MEENSIRNYFSLTHVPAILRLATPIVVAQLGMMMMILVDTMMVGKLGAEAIAAVGIGNTLFTSVMLFGTGALMGIETLASQAFGEGDLKKVQHWGIQSGYLALLLSLMGILLLDLLSFSLPWIGVQPELIVPVNAFLSPLKWALPPTLLFFCIRQYLATRSHVNINTVVILLANVLNYFLNRAFIRQYGIAGSGLATTITRYFLFVLLFLYALKIDWGILPEKMLPSLDAFKKLLKLGIPIGLQFSVRAGIFPVLGILVATMGTYQAAAHTIVVNLGSFFLTVPLGLSTAVCILVSQSRGASEGNVAKQVGTTAVVLGALVMALIATSLVLFRFSILGLFTSHAEVLELASTLCFVMAMFQVLDAIQMVIAGGLRGFHDARTALYSNVVAFWVISLPLGVLLAFAFGAQAMGIWIAFVFGLLTATFILIRKWNLILGEAI